MEHEKGKGDEGMGGDVNGRRGKGREGRERGREGESHALQLCQLESSDNLEVVDGNMLLSELS